MQRIHTLFAAVLAGLLLVAGNSKAECICSEPRLKPLRCVRGTITDPAGGRVSNATVTIVENGKLLATAQTSEDGKFSFDQPMPGRYELYARADGLRSFQYPIVVEQAAKKCRRVLAITLHVGGEECSACPYISQVKP